MGKNVSLTSVCAIVLMYHYHHKHTWVRVGVRTYIHTSQLLTSCASLPPSNTGFKLWPSISSGTDHPARSKNVGA